MTSRVHTDSTRQQLLLLKLRDAIADKEFAVSAANNDIAAYGGWQCDYYTGMRQADEAVRALVAELTTS